MALVIHLVMRTDGALRLILNVAVIPNMNVIITGDKYIRFVGIEEGKPVLFLLKVSETACLLSMARNQCG